MKVRKNKSRMENVDAGVSNKKKPHKEEKTQTPYYKLEETQELH